MTEPQTVEVTNDATDNSAASNKTVLESLGALGLAARVAGLLAIVGMLLPWLHIPALDIVGNGASLIGQDVQSSFAVFQLGNMGVAEKALNFVTSDGFSIFQGAWAASLAFLIVGLFLSFFGKRKTTLLKAGAVICVILVVAWTAKVGALNQDLAQQAGKALGSAGVVGSQGLGTAATAVPVVGPVLGPLIQGLGSAAFPALGGAVASGVSICEISYGPIVTGAVGACAFVLSILDSKMKRKKTLSSGENVK